jgi:hypothetical protein
VANVLGSHDTFKEQGVVYRGCYLHLDIIGEAPPVILYKCYMLDSTSLIMSVGTLGDSTITAQYSIWYFLLLVQPFDVSLSHSSSTASDFP